MSTNLGRFSALRFSGNGFCLEYEVAGCKIRELVQARSTKMGLAVQRHFQIGRVAHPLILVLGRNRVASPKQLMVSIQSDLGSDQHPIVSQGPTVEEYQTLRVRPCETNFEFSVVVSIDVRAPAWPAFDRNPVSDPAKRRWR